MRRNFYFKFHRKSSFLYSVSLDTLFTYLKKSGRLHYICLNLWNSTLVVHTSHTSHSPFAYAHYIRIRTILAATATYTRDATCAFRKPVRSRPNERIKNPKRALLPRLSRIFKRWWTRQGVNVGWKAPRVRLPAGPRHLGIALLRRRRGTRAMWVHDTCQKDGRRSCNRRVEARSWSGIEPETGTYLYGT